ncbi:MAG: HAMP domain-containing sensor histidine kinase [Myxococcota bacterium]
MSNRDDTPYPGDVDPDSMISERRLRVVDSVEQDIGLVADHSGDYNIKILRPLFSYVCDKFGQDTLADIIHDCGLPPSIIDRESGWISHQRFEQFLASARELVESDEEFMRACTYEYKKQYGAFLLLFRSISVRRLYELGARTMHMVCKVSRCETARATRTSIRVIYRTERDESRLVCLSRQASMKNTPTLFLGMPPAKLTEHACVAHGDDRCEYDLSWYEPLKMRQLGAGMLAGVLLALSIPSTIAHPTFSFIVLPILGAATGALLELRRLVKEQARFTADTSREMEDVIIAHAQATDELNQLRERERDWNRHVEEGVAARTRKLNAVVDRLRAVIQKRSGSFPVVQKTSSPSSSHSSAFVPERAEPSGPHRIASMETAVDRVSQLVGELVNIASDNTTKRNLEAEEVSVDNLVAQIRRQLKATMLGRNVRITVFQTREAPATVITFRQILDRVIDNVLLNASRHTDRGSVVVEASGTPGSLLIKLSDTGSGLSKERLEQVFDDNEDKRSGPSGPPNDRSGLAYAARLLDRIGGRLEIMSEPGVGTTLWLYIPVSPPASSESEPQVASDEPSPSSSNDGSNIVGRVVRIRSKLNPAATGEPQP